jgi:hypothetical protein
LPNTGLLVHQSSHASKVQRSLGLPLLPAIRNCCSSQSSPLHALLVKVADYNYHEFWAANGLNISPLLFPKELIDRSQQP